MKLFYIIFFLILFFSCDRERLYSEDKVYFDSTMMLIKHEKYCDGIPCKDWIYYHPDSSKYLEITFSKRTVSDSAYISEKKIYDNGILIKHSFYDEMGDTYKYMIPDKVLYHSFVSGFDEKIVSDTISFENFINYCSKCHTTTKYTGNIYDVFYYDADLTAEELFTTSDFMSHHDSLKLSNDDILKILTLIEKITEIHPREIVP